jgi:hypothetical protein
MEPGATLSIMRYCRRVILFLGIALSFSVRAATWSGWQLVDGEEQSYAPWIKARQDKLEEAVPSTWE